MHDPQKRIDIIIPIYLTIGDGSLKVKECHRIVYKLNPNSMVL